MFLARFIYLYRIVHILTVNNDLNNRNEKIREEGVCQR